jgi:hypothetical protein
MIRKYSERSFCNFTSKISMCNKKIVLVYDAFVQAEVKHNLTITAMHLITSYELRSTQSTER